MEARTACEIALGPQTSPMGQPLCRPFESFTGVTARSWHLSFVQLAGVSPSARPPNRPIDGGPALSNPKGR